LLVDPLNLEPVLSASVSNLVLLPRPSTSLVLSLGALPSITSTKFFSAQGSAVNSILFLLRTPSKSLLDITLS
jgi:hypothetical protein